MSKPGRPAGPQGPYRHYKQYGVTEPARVPCLDPACKLTFRTEHLRDMHIERFHRYLVEGKDG